MILEQVAAGHLSVDEALRAAPPIPELDLGFAKVDVQRNDRCGIPEIIYAAGKTPDHVCQLVQAMRDQDQPVMATRAERSHWEAVCARFPEAAYHKLARIITLPALPVESDPAAGRIAVVCAGTSDLPVAEEAAVAARFLGMQVDGYHDVGVAGLHRLINRLEAIRNADVVIAVAGMEGALPSVLGGLIDRPLIAVPTHVGYGWHLHGLAAFLAMLNSCAPGITLVNVDNGLGAAVAATRIARQSAAARSAE